MRHDSTVPLEYTLLIYYIMKNQAFNLGWVMNRVEKLCLKYLLTLVRYRHIEMGGKVNLAELNRLRTLHLNQKEERR